MEIPTSVNTAGPEMISTGEAARRLGRSTRQVLNLVNSGRLRARRYSARFIR